MSHRESRKCNYDPLDLDKMSDIVGSYNFENSRENPFSSVPFLSYLPPPATAFREEISRGFFTVCVVILQFDFGAAETAWPAGFHV